jgi:hypothetical protein
MTNTTASDTCAVTCFLWLGEHHERLVGSDHDRCRRQPRSGSWDRDGVGRGRCPGGRGVSHRVGVCRADRRHRRWHHPATQRFITGYAQDEAGRAGLDITFATVLPRFAPTTGVGRPAVQVYAALAGQSVDVYLDRLDYPLLTPEIAGTAMVELVRADAATVAPAYGLTGAGLQKLP